MKRVKGYSMEHVEYIIIMKATLLSSEQLIVLYKNVSCALDLKCNFLQAVAILHFMFLGIFLSEK